MPRFSISLAMALVALAAANCAAIRAAVPLAETTDSSGIFLLGMLPLLNAQIIGLYYWIASRYRISLRRRTPQERVGFAPVFAAVNALTILALIAACYFAPDALMEYLQYMSVPLEQFFESLGFQPADYENPLFRFVAWPLLLGAVMSGPPLVFASMASGLSSRYKLVIVSRPQAALPVIQPPAGLCEPQTGDNTR
jgi:hypothetical protein